MLQQAKGSSNIVLPPGDYGKKRTYTPKLLQDGDHADCIQAWSGAQLAPTSDLVIVDDWANGLVQDIFLGNHNRQVVSDGGFNRVVIRGNTVRVGMPNGKVLAGARGGEVKNTTVLSTPGALISNWPRREVRAKLLVAESSVVTCGDPVKRNTDNPGTEPCR